MLIALDVDYRADRVVTAAVAFAAWADAVAAVEHTRLSLAAPGAYEPGSFYKRELPYLLAILGELTVTPTLIVVDGFVALDGDAPGLGAHLHAALAARPPVVGVAKRPWRGGAVGEPVLRGDSSAPLWVTAVGIAVTDAARAVASMHGEHRTPTLLKRVDRLARDSHPA